MKEILLKNIEKALLRIALNLENKNTNESRVSLEKENVLCKHCKRTPSNGIRCLGICVADSEY